MARLGPPEGRPDVSVPQVRRASPVRCLEVASEFVRRAVACLISDRSSAQAARVVTVLGDAGAFLQAAHLLLTGRASYGEPSSDIDLRHGSRPGMAAHHIRRALLFTRQVSSPSGQGLREKARPAMAIVLTALAAERLQDALAQLDPRQGVEADV